MATIGYILAAMVLTAYIYLNVVVCVISTVDEMVEDFITGQCLVGKICVNILCAPAWAAKGVMAAVRYFTR